jgi:hypothetical protein
MNPSIERDLEILKKREEFFNLNLYGNVLQTSQVFMGENLHYEVSNIYTIQNSNTKITQYLHGITSANVLKYSKIPVDELARLFKKGQKK